MFVAMMQEWLKVSHSGVTTGKEWSKSAVVILSNLVECTSLQMLTLLTLYHVVSLW
jgi:hypothetical protein